MNSLLRLVRKPFGSRRRWKTFASASAELQLTMANLFCRQDVAAIERTVADQYDGRRVSINFEPSAVRFPMSCAWSREGNGSSSFTFPEFEPGLVVNTVVERWLSLFELFFAYERPGRPAGRVIINFNDAGLEPGLAFSANKPDYALIPDHVFFGTRGYVKERRHFERHARSWSERSASFFWRDTAIGREDLPLFEVPRVRLCQIAQAAADAAFDVGLIDSHEVCAADMRKLGAAGLMKEHQPWKQLGNFRFHIDIDGHANTYAALFRKLLSGGLVLKVASPDGYRQWYYDRLKPWENFVPVRSDMSDLIEVARYCRAHDELSRRVAENGRRLAQSLTYEREFVRALTTIKQAFAGS